MDSVADKGPFARLLDMLCATWGKPPATDAMQEAYWKSLKDVKLSEIRANVERILKTATKRDFFPKPAELRNDVPSVSRHDSNFEAAQAFSVRVLEEMKREDQEKWRMHVRLRYLDRLLVSEPHDSPIYSTALEESRILRPLVRGY
jgi:hypothetical protein